MKEYLRQSHLLILTHYLIKTMALWKKINSTLRILLISIVVLTILGIDGMSANLLTDPIPSLFNHANIFDKAFEFTGLEIATDFYKSVFK